MSSQPKGFYEDMQDKVREYEEKMKPYILTPKPCPEPRINGTKVLGARPGRPFMFTIPATGKRPMTFSAEGLPKGLKLDAATGRIAGVAETAGTYRVALKAANQLGSAERELRIELGDRLALTPPMGWNSWNNWAKNVSEKNVRASAKAMAEKGLVNHGWTYVNIDICWQGRRGGKYNAIQPNEKFTDMKVLCDYIHSLGLKAGIYSTPRTTGYFGTIGGSSDSEDGTFDRPDANDEWGHRSPVGKYNFDKNDAKQWVEWGFDYMKYDACPGYDGKSDSPQLTMGEALINCGRDMVYSCGNRSLENAARFAKENPKFGSLWRTGGDIRDVWDRSQFTPDEQQWPVGICEIWDDMGKWAPHTGPGHWADPDMMVLGMIGAFESSHSPGIQLFHPTRLTPDEQYAHMSLWCLWAAPLLLGCPLEFLDEFTLNLLTNDEVLEVDQDPLGEQARTVAKDGDRQVMAKNMEDGAKAVGLFNRSLEETEVKVKWTDLGVSGRQTVRDLWRHKDLGLFENEFGTKVNAHGVALVKIAPVERG